MDCDPFDRVTEDEQGVVLESWTEACQKGFDDLKRSMSTNPILSLSDVYNRFEVHVMLHNLHLEEFCCRIDIQ